MASLGRDEAPPKGRTHFMTERGSAETHIGAMIVDRNVCLDCIAAKANVTFLAAEDALLTLGRILPIDAVPQSTCSDCRRVKITFCLRSPRSAT